MFRKGSAILAQKECADSGVQNGNTDFVSNLHTHTYLNFSPFVISIFTLTATSEVACHGGWAGAAFVSPHLLDSYIVVKSLILLRLSAGLNRNGGDDIPRIRHLPALDLVSRIAPGLVRAYEIEHEKQLRRG